MRWCLCLSLSLLLLSARLGVTNKPHLFELRATLRRTTREAQVEDKKNSRHEENVKMKKEGSMASDEETVEDDAADIASVIPSPSGVDDSNRMSLVFSVAAKYSLKKVSTTMCCRGATRCVHVCACPLTTLSRLIFLFIVCHTSPRSVQWNNLKLHTSSYRRDDLQHTYTR